MFFTRVCLFTGGLLPKGGLPLRGKESASGRGKGSASLGRGKSAYRGRGSAQPAPPPNQKSRRYASYWNAFFLSKSTDLYLDKYQFYILL